MAIFSHHKDFRSRIKDLSKAIIFACGLMLIMSLLGVVINYVATVQPKKCDVPGCQELADPDHKGGFLPYKKADGKVVYLHFCVKHEANPPSEIKDIGQGLDLDRVR